MAADRMPGKYVRGGAPRVLRSPMTETWYVVTAYRDLGDGKFIASRKREVHSDDAAGLEAAYQAHRAWETGVLVEADDAVPAGQPGAERGAGA